MYGVPARCEGGADAETEMHERNTKLRSTRIPLYHRHQMRRLKGLSSAPSTCPFSSLREVFFSFRFVRCYYCLRDVCALALLVRLPCTTGIRCGSITPQMHDDPHAGCEWLAGIDRAKSYVE